MLSHVRSLGKDDEIVWIVVPRVAVDMMNDLAAP